MNSDKTNFVLYIPDSSTVSLVSSSLTTDAVKPTALDPFPDVYIPLGVILCTYDNNWLLLVPIYALWERIVGDIVRVRGRKKKLEEAEGEERRKRRW